MTTPPVPLHPGDVLLYSSNGLFGRLIQRKTWSSISHVEVVSHSLDPLLTITAKNSGVHYFPFTAKSLVAVLRPRAPLDYLAAYAWFEAGIRGQRYDWLGLIKAFMLRKAGSTRAMWCSEVVTGYLRAGGIEPFVPSLAAERVAPSMFEYSPAFMTVWAKESR